LGGAIAGALGGLAAVPEEWRTAVTEGSTTDLVDPADVMTEVAMDVFEHDRRRFEAHRQVVAAR
jgi:hypothetical protein